MGMRERKSFSGYHVNMKHVIWRNNNFSKLFLTPAGPLKKHNSY